MIDVIGRLTLRLDALRDGTPEVGRIIDAVWEALERYIFLTAYVAANRDSKDLPGLLAETMEDEDCWPENTDPDVLALFEMYRQKEVERRIERERENEGN